MTPDLDVALVYDGTWQLVPVAELGYGTHTRRKCLDSASSYQKRWLAAEAGREPLIGGMS